MSLITENGFVNAEPMDFLPADQLPIEPTTIAVDLSVDADPFDLHDDLHRIHTIRLSFTATSDGRGFSVARQLRQLGFKGRLRAQGPLISDQFRYALSCGFDEVETTPEIAARQPEAHWHNAGGMSYRDKLGKAPQPHPVSDSLFRLSVLEIQHYSNTVFRFRVTRPESFRFEAGEFVMLGLEHDGQPIFRAYSICSATWDEHLEFYSIKVPTGDLTRRLQWIRPGDTLLARKKTTGSLTSSALLPGNRLFMHATGTGVAPFLSLIQEPSLYQQFEQIILTHTGRHSTDLRYAQEVVDTVRTQSIVSEEASKQLLYLGSTTRESSQYTGRITDLVSSNQLFDYLHIPGLNAETDRIMLCGSKAFNLEMRDLFTDRGFVHGSLNQPGTLVWERAFVDQ